MKYIEVKEALLSEVNMSPGNLRALAADIDARAGMEFEMIVPGAAQEDDGYDLEPDWDSDESVNSIQDAFNFFYDGDYNSRRDCERLRESMEEDFSNWAFDRFSDRWSSDADEFIYSYLKDNADGSDIAEILELEGGEAEEIIETGPTKQDLAKAAEKVLEEGSGNDWYDNAEEDARQDFMNDDDLQSEWLEHEGMETMKDVSDNYDISWPHYYNPSTGGDVSVEDAADSFSRAIGRPVNSSNNYHGAKREEGHYVVEPDGSLEADDSYDGGLEFVSPPLPINELLDDLKKVKAWADKTGCYTNDSTGLHINVSVPGWQGNLEQLDFIKLALLMGDQYILDQFGRAGNTYCKSALKIVKDHIAQKPNDVQLLLDKMKEHLNASASKLIHSGATSKYTSINTKDGYVEFRSPGGDWLKENFDKIETTLLRFVVALDAAVDDTKYKQEYAKKLYKLLNPKDSESTLAYFARYAAGELPKQALKSFVRQAQLERKVKADPTGGQKYWWSVGLRSNPNYRIEVVGSSAAEAISAAMDSNTDLMRYNADTDFTTKPLRPFDSSPVKATVGDPRPAGGSNQTYTIRNVNNNNVVYTFDAENRRQAEQMFDNYLNRTGASRDNLRLEGGETSGGYRNALSQTDIENRLGWGGQADDANYEVVDRSNNRSVFKFIANTPQEAQRKYGQVLDVFGFPHDTENYGFREIALPGSTQDLQRQRAQGAFTGQWKVVDDSGRELYRFGGVGNSQADANRVAQQWINTQRAQGREIDARELDVLPIMG